MTFPLSIKGVVRYAGAVLLCHNDRDEWELPGGRLEPGETPEACVAREVLEEAGIDVEAAVLLDTYLFEVVPGRTVQIVTYGCRLLGEPGALVVSDEHTEISWIPVTDLDGIPLPRRYRESVLSWPEPIRDTPGRPR